MERRKKSKNEIKSISVNGVELLSSLVDYDTLEEIGAAIEVARMNFEKRRYVDKIHPYKISVVTKESGNFYRTLYREDGKKKQKLAKSEVEMYEWLFSFYHGGVILSPDMTLSELNEAWLNERKDDVKSKHISILTYEDDVRAWNKIWAKTELADVPISSIRAGDLMRIAKQITGEGIITKRAFHRLFSPIKLAFDYAIDYDLLLSNPARSIALSRLRFKYENDNSDNVYSREERDILLSYLDSLPKQDVYTLAVQLAACLGKRIGEIRALHWDDYDEEKRTMRISRQIARTYSEDGSKTYAEKPLKRNGKSHTIPVVDFAAEVIEKLREINGDKKYILNSDGELPIETNHFNSHLKQYCEACGITYRSSHKFRFYGVSEAYTQGIDENKILSYANHASIDMTRHYDRSRKATFSHDEAEAVFGFRHTVKTG